MEPKKFEIEAGNFYKTRDGKRVFVASVTPSPFYKDKKPILVYDEDGNYRWYRVDGSINAFGEDDYDLVAEWKEPKRIRCFAPVYDKVSEGDWCLGYGYRTHEEAREAALAGVRAIVEIDVEEGHGLGEVE
ncbi:MAG: hypothetical protein J0I79_16535 [Mesorhizobium sp.]|uniref:hypothetical protein n=1 Tax=Mesorhizobium sp. TaxID=1871066 RepID=UPI001ACDC034|nr:hypothetical protein [Mesorhizobium sp.]MBN9219554.1 hypothetical protein [Mesorhizobium sp.]